MGFAVCVCDVLTIEVCAMLAAFSSGWDLGGGGSFLMCESDLCLPCFLYTCTQPHAHIIVCMDSPFCDERYFHIQSYIHTCSILHIRRVFVYGFYIYYCTLECL